LECIKTNEQWFERYNVNSEGLPEFTVKLEDYNKQYMTVFGPTFPVKGIWFPGSGCDEHKTAISRMLVKRAPERPGFHELLKENQGTFERRLRCGINGFKLFYESRIEREGYEEAYPEWLYQPHAKRKMRLNEEFDNWLRGTDSHCDRDNVEYKLKMSEMLPEGKMRGIGDLGAKRTSATAYVFSSIKAAFEAPYTHKNYTFEFVGKPLKTKLSEVFDRLLNLKIGEVYMPYFSDDNCIAAFCSDGLFMCNGDIKQCDGSHFAPMLTFVRDFLRYTNGVKNVHYDAITRAFDYLYRPLMFRNKHNRRQKVKYNFKDPRMYSGFAGTTVVNNFASLLIGMSLQKLVPDPSLVTKEQFRLAYIEAAALVGYRLTTDVCSIPEDFQFLKHSPVFVDGEIHVCMNLAVWFRGHGMFDGDLPGCGPLEHRARAYNSEVAYSRLNWGYHDLNVAFQGLIIKRTSVDMTECVNAAFSITKTIGDVGAYIPAESVCKRYRILPDRFRDMCAEIRTMNLEDVFYSDLIQTIHEKDYG